MAQVTVEIGGRTYPLSCRDGDEAHLSELAGDIAAKADGLTASLGPMSESRLLLMAALMVADELHDARRGANPSWSRPRPPEPAAPVLDAAAEAAAAEAAARLSALLARAERLADTYSA
jgi:cell division protein ZapA